ncbi:MAG: hypothetical protein LUE64_06925, partial [Candidatus Gastranaerophilales bacterium]|nr:hypothetical protein [Candidatus Gastranaerophilales bacterium]
MKIIFTFFSLILFSLQPVYSIQSVSNYFNEFYLEYLEASKIDFKNRIVLVFLHEISNYKIVLIQK